jgi:pyruvate,water dikinase
VLKPEDCTKVRKGDIVVVDEFCPDFVEAARLAGALVSNRGGVTSHTAIIGRTLNIPTVVGTKKGTEYLKDGMQVLVDAAEGFVYELST